MQVTYSNTVYNGYTRTSTATVTSTYEEDLRELATLQFNLASVISELIAIEDETRRTTLIAEKARLIACITSAQAIVTGYEA